MLNLLISSIDDDLARVGVPYEYQEMAVTVTAFPFLSAAWEYGCEFKGMHHVVSVLL